jgi:uncharacterized protein (DUF1501 family)
MRRCGHWQDLQPTTGLRSLFKAVLDEHMRIDARALSTRVFPGSNGAPPLLRADARLRYREL